MTATAQSDRNRWLALYVLCAGMLMIVLDGTIVNVALPTIQESLGFSQSNLAWVVNAYLIPFGGLLIAVGIGTSFPGIMTLAMSGATPQDAGLASGLVNTSMQVGGAVGLAVLATLSTQRTEDLQAAGHSTAAALTSGYHLAYLVGAGLAAVAVLVAVFVLRPEPAPAVPGHESAGSPAAAEAAAIES